jgi:hypothetical protein
MKTANQFTRSFLMAALVMVTIAFADLAHATAQAASGATASPASQPKSLYITIVAGEGALNDIRTRTAREPIVQVDDENHKPVAGALVLFSLDKSGTSYANFGGMSSISVHTNEAGRAVASGFQITGRRGTYTIHVRASYGSLVAEEAFIESNIKVLVPESGPPAAMGGISHKKVWIVSSILAAGAIAGIVLATQQSSPTTVSAGTGTVGAPAAVSGIRFQLHSRRP